MRPLPSYMMPDSRLANSQNFPSLAAYRLAAADDKARRARAAVESERMVERMIVETRESHRIQARKMAAEAASKGGRPAPQPSPKPASKPASRPRPTPTPWARATPRLDRAAAQVRRLLESAALVVRDVRDERNRIVGKSYWTGGTAEPIFKATAAHDRSQRIAALASAARGPDRFAGASCYREWASV
jgi:hypothetical protein